MHSSSPRLGRRQLLAFAGVSLSGLLLETRSWAQELSSLELKTGHGPLILRPLKHSAVLATYLGKYYYIDPAQLPLGGEYVKADAIFITHEHGDHFDPPLVDLLRKPGTEVITNVRCAEKLGSGTAMKNGDTRKVLDVAVEAVPAYNLVRTQYHPRGRDNGFVINFGGKRVYFAGDTEATPELKTIKEIAVAFLPIKLPSTMSPLDAAEGARAIGPKILVPYHQGESNPQEVADALKGTGIDVRVMKLP